MGVDNMLTFDTYFQEPVWLDGMMPCRKKPIIIHAVQLHEEFRVHSLEGDFYQGKPGDYLMVGIDHEQYICDKDIFERIYDWVTLTKPLHPNTHSQGGLDDLEKAKNLYSR